MSELFGGALAGLPHRLLNLFLAKIIVFPQRRNDSAHLTRVHGMIFYTPRVVADTIFFHTSPAKRLVSVCSLLFPKWEHDFANAIFDLNFPNLHRAFGAANPMVRRTGGFGAANNAFKTQWILTVLFCGVSSATKLPFSAPESHSFLTRRLFHVVDRCCFFHRN